jgi:hypothetical protein
MTAAEYQEMIKKPNASKMRNKKTVVDGIRFDSQLEANYYCELKVLKRTGEVTDIKLQPRYPLQGGITYIADFLVTYADGRQEIVDCKGFRTAVYRMKKKLFTEKYPHLKILEVSA